MPVKYSSRASTRRERRHYIRPSTEARSERPRHIRCCTNSCVVCICPNFTWTRNPALQHYRYVAFFRTQHAGLLEHHKPHFLPELRSFSIDPWDVEFRHSWYINMITMWTKENHSSGTTPFSHISRSQKSSPLLEKQLRSIPVFIIYSGRENLERARPWRLPLTMPAITPSKNVKTRIYLAGCLVGARPAASSETRILGEWPRFNTKSHQARRGSKWVKSADLGTTGSVPAESRGWALSLRNRVT